ncbi:MAG: hypothetical protein LV481_14490 [Methylacidiphilales bacterium]|nr:hypothetical protein [Candidatus Methylacidiphilales bacterium]
MTVFGRLTVIALSLVFTASVCQAANLEGFLIYAPPAGSEASQGNIVAFSDIYWLSPNGGSITTMSGSTATFSSASIAQFVYLDDAYWRMMNDNASYKPFRTGVFDREVVIPGEHSDIISDNEIHLFTIGSQTLDSLIKAAPDYAAALTPVKTELDADITRYQSGERKVNDQWMSVQDYQATYGKPSAPASTENWTTLDGKTYKNVVVNAQDDDGVTITYTGGVAKIPYYELPLQLQKRFGQDYDSLVAKKKAAEKALAEATRHEAERNQQQNGGAAAQSQTEQGGGYTSQTPAQTTPQAITTAQPNRPAPAANPTTPPAQVENQSTYAGSIYSYSDPQDICYLDSPAVVVWPESPDLTATATNLQGRQTLALRITTEGNQPEAPEKIEATFLSTSTAKKPDYVRKVKFLVDGVLIPVSELKNTDGDVSFVAGRLADRVSFYLPSDQAKSIFNGKNVTFSVGNDTYRIDQNGLSAFQKYFTDVDRLPPAASQFVRTYHSILAKRPSLTETLGTVCEYVIYGFVILSFVAIITAFVLCASTFLKM